MSSLGVVAAREKEREKVRERESAGANSVKGKKSILKN